MKLKYRVIERFRDRYSIVAMCRVLEVSRSGYYAWRNRQGKASKEQWLVDLIIECQRRCRQTYGCRRVRRWFQRNTGRTVNLRHGGKICVNADWAQGKTRGKNRGIALQIRDRESAVLILVPDESGGMRGAAVNAAALVREL